MSGFSCLLIPKKKKSQVLYPFLKIFVSQRYCFACSRDSESCEPRGALVILLILVVIHNFVQTWSDLHCNCICTENLAIVAQPLEREEIML